MGLGLKGFVDRVREFDRGVQSFGVRESEDRVRELAV